MVEPTPKEVIASLQATIVMLGKRITELESWKASATELMSITTKSTLVPRYQRWYASLVGSQPQPLPGGHHE